MVYPCRACGSKNRILRSRVPDDPRCGRCREGLFPRHTVPVTDATWKQEVEDWPIPVLVDFWAPWCGPCRVVGPVLEEIAAERAGTVKFAKLNVDENPLIAGRFGIQSIPTMMVFRGTQVLDQIRGAVPKAAIEARLVALG